MHLNLARKWRSRTFQEIVGQELSVRILKNSLYRGYYFPVYLFSGQRGSGKTSMARIFAGALNCESLINFQIDPKNATVPCLSCRSCGAMANGSHPDFIEIDAASHTGVDHVRTIIEAAALLPTLGTKRIYLIDEAHMLSKAAFNAFLKILEEPPATVHFILATTDLHKVLETVRSRSFQLFFKHITTHALTNHLKTVCAAEEIPADADALLLIAQESEGSVRDALNLLEQVRFSSKRVTRAAVQQALGFFDEALILQQLELIIRGHQEQMLATLDSLLQASMKPIALWQALVSILQALIAVQVKTEVDRFAHYQDRLVQLSRFCPLARCSEMLDILYQYESLFLKTTAPRGLIELTMLRLSATAPALKNMPSVPVNFSPTLTASSNQKNLDIPTNPPPTTPKPSTTTIQEDHHDSRWHEFLLKIETIQDPLISSIFKQVALTEWNNETALFTVTFAKDFSFFNELLDNTQAVWKPIFKKLFGESATFNTTFSAELSARSTTQALATKQPAPTIAAPPIIMAEKAGIIPKPPFKKFSSPPAFNRPKLTQQEAALDVSDTTTWKLSNALLALFPGTVTIVPDKNKD